MAKPTWSGQIQILLVSIGVKIFPASNPARQTEFHLIDRQTGKRVHHQNVSDGESVDKVEIVKGFEYAKGKYIQIEPKELSHLRIPTAGAMEIKQFVKTEELPLELFDRPYFVVPKDDVQAKAVAIMRKGLIQTGTMGIGEIAFAGREHLVALGPPPDPKQKGLMLYALRYSEELRSAKALLADVKQPQVDTKELALVKQLINGSTGAFRYAAYKNDYQSAVRKLVDAKRKSKPLAAEEPKEKRGKVINLMDALRKSVATSSAGSKRPARGKKAA